MLNFRSTATQLQRRRPKSRLRHSTLPHPVYVYLGIKRLITRGRNAIFGHVARLPENIPAHHAVLRQVELSVSRPPDLTWKPPPGRPRTKWTDQLCRDNSNVPIATLWRQAIGPNRLRVNDDDDDDDVSKEVYETSHSRRTRG